MDVGLAQACKAAALARSLSDTEIFLLVESEPFPKSDDQRAFPRALFRSISIIKRVENKERSVEKAVDSLLEKGFLAALGSDMVHTTQIGNTVKHSFRDLRSAMSLKGVDPAELRTVHFCSKLRKEMAANCKQQERA